MNNSHDVFNQTPPLSGLNLYERNAALREGINREGAGWAHDWLLARGAELGSESMQELAAQANQNPPVLKAFSATGFRRDEVEFHPAYHELMAYLKRHGGSCGPWADQKPGAHVARAAFFQLYAEVEDGTLCPTTMTYAVVPVLNREPKIAAIWLDKILSPEYDKRFIPGLQKTGVTLGMGMTEKQGGTDVRTNSTRAEPVGDGDWGKEYRLIGHKWFFSAPMSDAFLVLAQAPGGLSCFFVPRFGPDGACNDIRIQRLKDKMGDRSNAGSEVEFWNTRAWLVGQEGRGVPTIIEMGTWTRLDCVLGTAGLMRSALALALHHAKHREVFGKTLAQQPLMQNVLADLALETEAAQTLALRLAGAFDRREQEHEALLMRLLTPAAKYWVCKRGPALAAEAMEVLGGNGYVEEGLAARIYRQMPLNSIWEGSGNVMCLDVLRALGKHGDAVDALAAELAPALNRHAAFDRHATWLLEQLKNPDVLESNGRALTQGIALAVQGAQLLRYAPDFVSAAFCDSRFGSSTAQTGGAFGNLPAHSDFTRIIERAWPN